MKRMHLMLKAHFLSQFGGFSHTFSFSLRVNQKIKVYPAPSRDSIDICCVSTTVRTLYEHCRGLWEPNNLGGGQNLHHNPPNGSILTASGRWQCSFHFFAR